VEKTKKMTVAIAGATGFIGRLVTAYLSSTYHVIGLSRSAKTVSDDPSTVDEWRQCDLFSMSNVERALQGVDFAIYLVHSMMPRDRLTQGSFSDLDVLLADNFALGARKNGLKQIIYLGGMIPQSGPLSKHLESRFEVEHVLASSGVPLTTLRAGLILGKNGSSARILTHLVKRLPIMLCPNWIKTANQPIVADDMARVIARAVGDERTFGRIFDVGGSEIVTYRWLLKATAQAMGRSTPVLVLPFISVKFSKLWISTVASAPRALVDPLIDSLGHEMIATNNDIWTLTGLEPTPLSVGIKEIAQVGLETPRAFQGRKPDPSGSIVRSVQRLPKPSGMLATEVAELYIAWLPKFLRFILRVQIDDKACAFYGPFVRKPMLILTTSTEHSFPDRRLFFITGGLLASNSQRGRLEFREVLDGKHILACIHDYRPSLWWGLYRWGQAPVHAWVMASFSSFLSSYAKESVSKPSL